MTRGQKVWKYGGRHNWMAPLQNWIGEGPTPKTDKGGRARSHVAREGPILRDISYWLLLLGFAVESLVPHLTLIFFLRETYLFLLAGIY